MRREPYYFHVQRDFRQFWAEYGAADRKILFVFGLGFDPRCVPALRAVSETFVSRCYVNTVCTRFTNVFDRQLKENMDHTRECLAEIRTITDALSDSNYQHYEIEVNLFSDDQEVIGGNVLIAEFDDAVSSRFAEFTDVIVDISAFPRVLMYSLLAHLWNQRRVGQNLFAVLTDVDMEVPIRETTYFDPVFIFGPSASLRSDSYRLWIPILGGSQERLTKIYDFLNPTEVFPILPFPSDDPRRGDEIMLNCRELFDRWNVPFTNIMYASGRVPFDVYRKIHDIVESYGNIVSHQSMVVSALSGRSLSLGVFLAALRCNLRVCHIQPTTYRVDIDVRRRLRSACDTAKSTIYWLDGELYE